MRNYKATNLVELQKQYDQMKAIAMSSIENNVDLDPRFERELLSLTKLVKSLGGKA